jgi:molybdopterin/thiamine biosynthesis adenylyltransferase
MEQFDYNIAFKRNLGLVTPEEQNVLRRSRAAILGLGGMGGINTLMLARMGVGRFHLADFDEYSQANINRQVGATMSTVGKTKTAVIADMIRDINPEAEIRIFEKGVGRSNVEAVIREADLVIDSVDFFALDAREMIYREARRWGRPVLFAAPIGFSGTLHVFTADGMSFEDYFDFRPGMSYFERLIAFMVGLFPGATHWSYMDTRPVSITERTGPSLSCACHTGAGLLGAEALVILLKRRPPVSAPTFTQFDPYALRYVRGKLRWGNRGPIQRLKRFLVARKFRHLESQLPPPPPVAD